ncbi:hypothetical protein ACFFPL_02430 [Paeniglutamicibacter sulfureus]
MSNQVRLLEESIGDVAGDARCPPQQPPTVLAIVWQAILGDVFADLSIV